VLTVDCDISIMPENIAAMMRTVLCADYTNLQKILMRIQYTVYRYISLSQNDISWLSIILILPTYILIILFFNILMYYFETKIVILIICHRVIEI